MLEMIPNRLLILSARRQIEQVKVSGETYTHKMASLKKIQAKGFQIWEDFGNYRIPELNLTMGIAKHRDETVALVYSTDSYHKLYDEFDYKKVSV